MGEHRQTVGVMAVPELKRALEQQAKIEGRSTSNLCERLLEWALQQLENAGDSQTLVKWKAAPKGTAEDAHVKKRGSRAG